jgi:hypothetical protein
LFDLNSCTPVLLLLLLLCAAAVWAGGESDDCCPFSPNSQPIGNVSLLARLYNLIKHEDPLHLTYGAIQCSTAWMWTDVVSYLPPSAPVKSAVIPFANGSHQPRLQLSLDVILWEHYSDTLRSGPPATMAARSNVDKLASIRYGAWWEPLTNCHGLWYLGGFHDYPATPRATKSALWLSVLTADLPLQLTFVLEGNAWSDPLALADDGWLQTAAVSAWGAEARMLASSFFPAFESEFAKVNSGDGNSLVIVEHAALLRQAVEPDPTPVRARGWREPCGPEFASNSSGLCLHIIVRTTCVA